MSQKVTSKTSFTKTVKRLSEKIIQKCLQPYVAEMQMKFRKSVLLAKIFFFFMNFQRHVEIISCLCSRINMQNNYAE